MSDFKYPHNSTFFFKRVFVVFIFFWWGNSIIAQNIPVPEKIQAALLSKVLKYNPQIQQKKKIKILVVYDTNYLNSKNEFVNGLGNSMEIKAINPIELESNISGYDLVYFMPGTQNKSNICKKYKVLSVAGIYQYVEQGDISLGFVIENNKPKILINLTSLDKEGQSFSSDILRIAKIFN